MTKNKSFDEDSYFTATQSGPIVRFNNPRNDVIITWKNPPDDYTRQLKVMPIVTEPDEYDAVCFSLGKSIMDHFLGKK